MRSIAPHVAIDDRRRRVRRMWAAAIVVSRFVASWFVPGPQIARALTAFMAVGLLMFIVELTADPRQKLSSRDCWRIHSAPIGNGLARHSVGFVLMNAFIISSA
jgi:hypothetical protein